MLRAEDGRKEKTMTEYAAMKAKEFGLAATTTPETLEGRFFCEDGKMVTFGELTIIAGYCYSRRNGENSYFWAAYRNEGGIEDNTNLEAVSSKFYEDDGHALAAAFNWAARWARKKEAEGWMW